MRIQAFTGWAVGLTVAVLAGCGAGEPPAAETLAPAVVARQIVTVDVPPTLSRAERIATQQARPTTPTEPPPTPTLTPSPYIGVFLGAAESGNLPPMQPVIPTAFVELDAGACVIPPDAVFGDAWRRDASLVRQIGCPIQERFGFAGSVQVFEQGVMYRREQTNEVWAVNPGRLGAGRYWYQSQVNPLTLEGVTAPTGQRVPVDYFAAMWAGVPGVRAALGFGITPEQVADLNIQRFEGGTLLLDVTVGQVFVLLANGDAYGPF